MNRRAMFVAVMLLVLGAGGAKSFAGGASSDSEREGQIIRVGWEDSERGELQAPRAMLRDDPGFRTRETAAPRAGDVQVPREDGVLAPRGVQARTPCASEDQPPRWRED